MASKVAGIKHPLVLGLHEQGIGIEGAVVHEVRRNPKGPDFDRLPVAQESRVGKGLASWHVAAGCREDVVRGLTDVHRHFGTDEFGQSEVVEVRMGEEHPQQAIVGVSEARNVRQQVLIVVVGGIQG